MRRIAKRKWWAIVVIVALMATLLLPACAKEEATPPPPEKPPAEKPPAQSPVELNIPDVYKIGFMQGLTGPGASAIQLVVNVAKIAEEDINAAGGIDGVPIKLIFEDHQVKSAIAVERFRKLVDIDHVPTTMNGYTGPVLACAPIADETKTLMINHGAVGPSLIGCGKYVFHNISNSSDEMRVIYNYAKDDMGIKKIGFVYVNDDMGLSMLEFTKAYLPKIGMELVGSVPFDLKATDFSSTISIGRGWKADAIFLATHESGWMFVKQAYEAGWHPQWLSTSIMPDYPAFLTEAGPAVEGAVIGEMDMSHERLPDLKKLIDKYEAKYNMTLPAGIYIPLATAYDYVYTIADCTKYAKDKAEKEGYADFYTGEKLREALLEIGTFPGASGETIFDPETGCCCKAMHIAECLKDYPKPGEYGWKDIKAISKDELLALPTIL